LNGTLDDKKKKKSNYVVDEKDFNHHP